MIGRFGPFEYALAHLYRFEEELGRGAMGVVYRVTDLKLGRSAAIKMLHPALTNEHGVARFRSEIKIAANLTHPNIVAVHESGEVDGRLYYTMDYLGGETLRVRLRHEKQLSVEDALRIVECVAEGLQYAHDHAVVHRDVKPENILLAEGRVLVMDFGLARALSDVDTGRLTASGLVVGTPHYLSPEQASAEKEVGPRADQYALACVLYEMLVGEPPFTGPTGSAIASRHLSEPPPALRARRRTVSVNIETGVARALEKVPADRFPNIRQFSAHVRDTSPIAELPIREVRMQSRSFRRIGVGAVLVVLGLSLGVLAFRNVSGTKPGLFDWLTVASKLDSNLVAVAPFNVSGADTVWREGLIDLMYPTFDGAGPLHSLTTKEVLRAATNVRDAAAAYELGRSTRSGLVIFGRLVGVGMDSVRLRATLLDVRNRAPLADVDLIENTNHVDRLADSACVRLLRDLGASRPIGAVRTTYIGSQSMPALKAFLRGEQLYRRNDWVKAETLYQQSIRADDRFALALHRLRNVMRGTRGEDDAPSFRYALLAGQLNHGLSPRDSLLIVADSLYAAMSLSPHDPRWWSILRRRLAILKQASENYPRDPEVWLELGEAQLHYRDWIGGNIRETFHSFLHAIQQDSAFAPAYYHAIELGARVLPADQTFRTIEKYLVQTPGDVAVRVLRDLLSPDVAVATAARIRLDTLDALTIFDAAYLIRFMPDSEELAVGMFRALDRGDRFGKLSRGDSMRVERWWFRALAIRGHLREAYQHAGDGLAVWSPEDYVQLAVLGVVPADRASATLKSWIDTADASRAMLSIPWWYAMRDSASLARFRRRLNRSDRVRRPTTHVVNTSPYALSVLEAYLELLRRDTVGAIRAFSSVPDSLCGGECTADRIQRSTLLRTAGRPAEAVRLLQSHPPRADFGSILEILWTEEHAKASEAAGEAQAAAEDRTYLARIWRHPDSPLRRAIQ